MPNSSHHAYVQSWHGGPCIRMIYYLNLGQHHLQIPSVFLPLEANKPNVMSLGNKSIGKLVLDMDGEKQTEK